MKVGISTLTEAVDIGCNNDKSSHLFTYLTRGDVVCPLQTLIMIHFDAHRVLTACSNERIFNSNIRCTGAISKITFSIHVSK